MSERVRTAIEQAILGSIAEASVSVTGEGGHYAIEVVAPVFEGRSRLQRDRLVMQAISPLMRGDAAPVHAVDALVTRPR